ncbi:MAG: tRNA pseudouridine(38-40) synthase TruA [Bradymonadaceae bacterium]
MKLRLHIAYDGTAYHGWQIQPSDRTVEGELTRALQTLLGADEPVKVQGASRTDAGVHARGQVAHIEHDTNRSPWEIVRGLNALTDDDILVTRIEEVDPSFHARHSARGKIYRYRIWNHRFAHPFERLHTWRVPLRLDLEAMRKGASLMVGTHDFCAFRGKDCQSETTEREMQRVDVSDDGAMINVVVEGSAFLRYMVRIMVGTLVDIGSGRLAAGEVEEMLSSGLRTDAGQTAPPLGLSLEVVHYPDYPWEREPEIGGEPT